MEEEWQELALNSRRLPHGKSKKGGKSSGRHGAGQFNPKQAIAHYALTSSSSATNNLIPKSGGDSELGAEFCIHDFTEQAGGFVGSLQNSTGSLRAAIFLAGSRKLLYQIVGDADEDDGDDGSDETNDQGHQEEASDDEDGKDSHDDDHDDRDDEPEEASIETADRKHNGRVQAFAKNSFKSPKFWFQWQGEITPKLDDARSSPQISRERNLGYIVFDKNSCETFKGTISCRTLGWKDVEISGRKVGRGGVTTAAFRWSDFAVDQDDEDEDEDDVPDES